MKITLQKFFETSKAISTEAGGQLQEFIEYMSQLAEQTIRNLRNGLTFQNNFNCDVNTVELTHETEQIINTTQSASRIYGVIPLRVISTETGVDSVQWYITAQNTLSVKLGFTGSPSTSQNVTLLILYG